jgi:hypothetical protein
MAEEGRPLPPSIQEGTELELIELVNKQPPASVSLRVVHHPSHFFLLLDSCCLGGGTYSKPPFSVG